MRIRDAASLVLVDKSQGDVRVLMGRRAAAHTFMPNVYVFPGGRVDRTDRYAPFQNDYHPDTQDLLLQQMRGRATPLRARMLGLAAIRETYEEVGLMVGAHDKIERDFSEPTWRTFQKHGLTPDLSKLTYIARAITPPGHKRRFDTRFFMCDCAHLPDGQTASSSEELENVKWVSLSETRAVETHFITRRILLAVQDALHHQENEDKVPPVPFYQAKPGASDKTKVLIYLRSGKPPQTPIDVPVSD